MRFPLRGSCEDSSQRTLNALHCWQWAVRGFQKISCAMCRPLSVRSDERTSLRIKLGKAGSDGLLRLPDWRITCFFVARTHRHRGVANVALAGALGAIVRLGGGLVENYPEDTLGRKVSGSFLS